MVDLSEPTRYPGHKWCCPLTHPLRPSLWPPCLPASSQAPWTCFLRRMEQFFSGTRSSLCACSTLIAPPTFAIVKHRHWNKHSRVTYVRALVFILVAMFYLLSKHRYGQALEEKGYTLRWRLLWTSRLRWDVHGELQKYLHSYHECSRSHLHRKNRLQLNSGSWPENTTQTKHALWRIKLQVLLL